MSITHTPGPWNFEFDTIYTGDPTKQPDRETVVAQAAHRGFEKDEQAERLANARLIATAPDLLFALRRALSALESVSYADRSIDKACEMARAAIAKATEVK